MTVFESGNWSNGTLETIWTQENYYLRAAHFASDIHHTIARHNGRMYRVDVCGSYDELIEIPLDRLDMVESYQNSARVAKYAAWYNAGSLFPPIAVCGTTPDHDTYRVVNGHHRVLAARQAGCATIWGWSCAYVDRGNGKPIYTPARISETETGRAIAAMLDRGWCPRCGNVLNYDAARDLCHACAIDQDHGGFQNPGYYSAAKTRLGF